MTRDTLPKTVRDAFERHLEADLESSASLRTTLARYVAQLEASFVDDDALFNLELAQRVGRGCSTLLDGFDAVPEAERSLIQAAVSYFVETNDDEGDLDSVMGFDDDAAVFSVVARELGRADLVIADP